MGNKFEFIEYNGIGYPVGYNSKIKEIAGHLDKVEIDFEENYSLHTEYSYGKRKFDSYIIEKYPVLRESNKDGVPQLWKSKEWANEFASFILELTFNHREPQIIEIHPPFNDYSNVDCFIEIYQIFEDNIKERYQNVKIFIENRAGAIYRGGKFVISTADDIVELCKKIKKYNLKLGVVLDFPQLLTAEKLDTINFNIEKYNSVIDKIYPYQDMIQGIHVWGKKKNPNGRWVAHCGNLDTFFEGDILNKKAFLNGINKICNDGKKRFLVPEVNSGYEDMLSIINDLIVNS